jgi:hypothetical protein
MTCLFRVLLVSRPKSSQADLTGVINEACTPLKTFEKEYRFFQVFFPFSIYDISLQKKVGPLGLIPTSITVSVKGTKQEIFVAEYFT